MGPLLSWTSTALYLLSRLPQLLKNHSRRSTAGLSISLFIAAFFGNLFYSASMLANPLFWSDYPAHGCNGWAGHKGSDRLAWIKNAAPFFLGAAGVLMLDAAVAGQFWWFGREERLAEEQDFLNDNIHIHAGELAAKASIVSTRLDSERTLVGSRDGATTPTTALLAAAKAAGGSKPTSLRSEPIHTIARRDASRSRSRRREGGAEPVLVVGHPVPISDDIGAGYRWSWKEVDGWMRGWKPSYSNIPALGEGGGMSGYRSGFTSRPGTSGWNNRRPKSRLKHEVRTEEEDEAQHMKGEDVLEGSETQALLAGNDAAPQPDVDGGLEDAAVDELPPHDADHDDDEMEIRHGSGGGVMDD